MPKPKTITYTQLFTACALIGLLIGFGGYHLAELVYDYKIEQLKTDVQLTKYLAIIVTFDG